MSSAWFHEDAVHLAAVHRGGPLFDQGPDLRVSSRFVGEVAA
jgi:hypothetical protein